MPIFNGSENFLDLYLEAVGESEVPFQFHYWTALSLIAACIENRVWMERFVNKPIYPNQYTMLIGDSAAGKGTAMGLGNQVLHEIERQRWGGLNEVHGALTRAGLQDEMADRWHEAWSRYELDLNNNVPTKEPTGCALYFIGTELSSALGTGNIAKDTIKLLTEWWEGGIGNYRERTRTSGVHAFKNPCINFVAGTTKEWCREVIDENDLRSGFWARVSCVMGQRDFNKRIARPNMDKWASAVPLLAWRLSLLQKKRQSSDIELFGKMHFSSEADEADIHWYETRPEEESDLLKAHWARQGDQVWRVAMLLKLAEYFDLLEHPWDESWKVIELKHVLAAQTLTDQLTQDAGIFMGQSLTHKHARGAAHVEDVLRKKQHIQQTPELLRMVSRFGVKSRELETILQGLEDEQKVERTTQGNGKYVVHWIGGLL